MNKTESAVKLFERGHACSQAILSVYGKEYGLDPKLALKLASGFAGGMRQGEICGAVTGAYMVLGLAFCGDDGDSSKGRENVYNCINGFSRAFKMKNGSIRCKTLLGRDISTNEGMDKAKSAGLFKTACVQFVRDASEILEEFLTRPHSVSRC